MTRETWSLIQYGLLLFVAIALVMLASGCKGDPVRKYKLSNGKVVECASAFNTNGGVDLSDCIGGSKYWNQMNVEVLPE